jgi:hypothetical protein
MCWVRARASRILSRKKSIKAIAVYRKSGDVLIDGLRDHATGNCEGQKIGQSRHRYRVTGPAGCAPRDDLLVGSSVSKRLYHTFVGKSQKA